jgi:hypothetical protein
MTKRQGHSWQDIVPAEMIPVFRWFYKELLPEMFLLPRIFWHSGDKQLYLEWNQPQWLDYYGQFPVGILSLLAIATDKKLDPLSIDQKEYRQKYFELLKEIRNKLPLIEANENTVRKLTNYALPKLLPLKLSIFVILNHLSCFVVHRASIPDLISKVHLGDDEALFQLVSVDKTFLEMPEIQKRIRAATLFDEDDFFARLGKAIRAKSCRSELFYHIDDCMIAISWGLGFRDVGVEQFGFFLHEIGMTRFNSTSSLQRKLNRLGISAK